MALPGQASKQKTSRATPPGRKRRRKIATAGVKRRHALSPARVASARRKFLRAFPAGFKDETYLDWERAYKWRAHLEWHERLDVRTFRHLLRARQYTEIASRAIRIESRTNLLFSFEKMALRDAVRSRRGAERFATALFNLLHGRATLARRFEEWIEAISELPRKQTRVLTWPLATVFGFLAQPDLHFFFKPTVTRAAARRFGEELLYASRPSWGHYQALLEFVEAVRRDIRDLKPKDMIDLQSFLWVQGSDEYPD
jgi:hypothetical protein